MTTATATATLAVNAAFMQEIKDEHLRLQLTLVELNEQCKQFYQELDRHESQENDLILRAFDEDIGVGD